MISNSSELRLTPNNEKICDCLVAAYDCVRHESTSHADEVPGEAYVTLLAPKKKGTERKLISGSGLLFGAITSPGIPYDSVAHALSFPQFISSV